MCLPGIFSDHMFLCSKYGVRPTSTRDSIRDAVTHAFMASVGVFCSFFITGSIARSNAPVFNLLRGRF